MRVFGTARRAGFALALPVAAALAAAPVFAQEEEEDPQQQQQEQQEEMQEPQAQQQEDNLLAVAEESGQLTLFVRALKQAGLAGELENKGPYTVLAPTDEAFRAHFSEEELDRLLGGAADPAAAGVEEPGAMEEMEREEDPEQRRIEDPVMEGEQRQEGYGQQQAVAGAQPDAELVRILRAHILTGEVPASRLQGVRSVQNVLGQELTVSSGAQTEMAQARTEYETETEEAEGQEQEEAEREQKTETEQAQMEPARSETQLQVGEANVVETDIRASNGILHLIDGIIMPETAAETQERQMEHEMEQDTTERDTTTVPPVR